MKRYLSTLALLIASTSALAIEVPSIEVRGRMISVGQTADTLFSILQPTDIDRQKVENDYMHPGGLRVTKYVSVERKIFTVVLIRRINPGPYEIVSIDVLSPGTDHNPRQNKVVKSRPLQPAALKQAQMPKSAVLVLKETSDAGVFAVADLGTCVPLERKSRSFWEINEKGGYVELAFLLAEDGRIADTKIAKSSGYPDVDSSVFWAMRQCKFPANNTSDASSRWIKLRYELPPLVKTALQGPTW